MQSLAAYLSGCDDAEYIIQGFTEGFRIGFVGPHVHSYARNHKSVTDNEQVFASKISKELSANRICGPFKVLPFPNLRVSPLGLIPKRDGDYRVIHDLSYPKGQGINADIPREFTHVQYETLDWVLDLIRKVGRGALIAKADIENAFRLLPIHPDDHELLGFCFNGYYYYDCCLPMGCSSSCRIFEKFSTSLQWIMAKHYNVTSMTHILDDFIFVNSPSSQSCLQDLEAFLNLASRLNIPIKQSKTCQPATVATVHGVEVDTIDMKIRLPADKLSKLVTLLDTFSKRKKSHVDRVTITYWLPQFCMPCSQSRQSFPSQTHRPYSGR